MAAAGDQLDAVAAALDAKAVSVKFDLVESLRARKHVFTVGRQAELEFEHGTDIGLLTKIANLPFQL
jgi:hypothetical protein